MSDPPLSVTSMRNLRSWGVPGASGSSQRARGRGGWSPAPSRRGRLVFDDGVADRADALHSDLDDVARGEPDRWCPGEPDAAGGPGRDDVTGQQPGEGREKFDTTGDIHDHLRGAS